MTNIKKKIAIILGWLLIGTTVSAGYVNVDRVNSNSIQPIIQTDFITAPYFYASSTSATSTFAGSMLVGTTTSTTTSKFFTKGTGYFDTTQGVVDIGGTASRIINIGGNTNNTTVNIRSNDTVFDTDGESVGVRLADSASSFKGSVNYLYRAARASAGLTITSIDSTYFEVNGGTTPSVTFASTTNVGIGTSTPYSKLSVEGQIVASNIFATSSSATSTFTGGFQRGSGSTGVTMLTNGSVGIGQIAPLVKLAVGAVTAALSTNIGATGQGISGTGSIPLGVENTSASSATAGSLVGLYSNDGAAMAAGDRLGGFLFGGSSSASALRNSAAVIAYASALWVDASSYPTYVTIETTAPSATTRTERLRVTESGSVLVGTTTSNALVSIYGGGLGVNPGATGKPTCDSSKRGVFWNTFSGAGVKDSVEVCTKDAGDLYGWRVIY